MEVILILLENPAPRKVISCILVERIVFANGTGALNATQVLLPGIP